MTGTALTSPIEKWPAVGIAYGGDVFIGFKVFMNMTTFAIFIDDFIIFTGGKVTLKRTFQLPIGTTGTKKKKKNHKKYSPDRWAKWVLLFAESFPMRAGKNSYSRLPR